MKSNFLFLRHLISGTYNTALLTMCGVLFVGYFTCVVGTIISVNERKDVRIEMRNLQMRVAELESEYVQLSSAVTKERAFALGYIEAVNPLFIYRGATVPSEQVARIP